MDDELQRIVTRLRQQGTDDAGVEVKSSSTKLTSDIWDSISAFANTAGGTVILGLAEKDSFRPVEHFALDRVRDQFVEGIGDGGTQGARLTNPPAYGLRRGVIDGASVLVITIAENQPGAKPCFVTAKGVNGGSYKRVDDKNIKLSATEIFEFQNLLLPSDADGELIDDAEPSDLDGEIVASLLTKEADSKALHGARTREEKLKRLNIMDSTGRVRLAGLLVVGSYPQQYLPRLLVDVAVHPGREKSLPEAGPRFLDRVQAVGPLADVVDEAVNAVTRNLRTHSVVQGAARREVPEIPTEVVREAIANAVVHREYAPIFRGQPVTVDVFSDRIEISNPGGLWGGKTRENLDDGTSRCRNQKLLQLMQRVAVRGHGGFTVEGQGSGVRLMINGMRAHALNKPTFDVTPDQVRVTLWRHGAAVPEHRDWLHHLVNRELSPREDAALLLAKQNGEVSVTALRETLRIDSDESRVLLEALRQEGVLRESGKERYLLAEGAPLPSESQMEIIRVLSASDPVSIREIAEAVGRTVNGLRQPLRALVKGGWVVATAPTTSRLRKYLVASDDH